MGRTRKETKKGRKVPILYPTRGARHWCPCLSAAATCGRRGDVHRGSHRAKLRGGYHGTAQIRCRSNCANNAITSMSASTTADGRRRPIKQTARASGRRESCSSTHAHEHQSNTAGAHRPGVLGRLRFSLNETGAVAAKGTAFVGASCSCHVRRVRQRHYRRSICLPLHPNLWPASLNQGSARREVHPCV
jgi:hypothetical protein